MKKAAKLGELGLGKSRARPGEKSSKGVAVDKQERGKRLGVASISNGGGGATALVIEII